MSIKGSISAAVVDKNVVSVALMSPNRQSNGTGVCRVNILTVNIVSGTDYVNTSVGVRFAVKNAGAVVGGYVVKLGINRPKKISANILIRILSLKLSQKLSKLCVQLFVKILELCKRCLSDLFVLIVLVY